MATRDETQRVPLELRRHGKNMRKHKLITTTLGDLIAAITDEVKPWVREPSGRYTVVSYIINDLLAHRRGRARRRTLRRYPRSFAMV
jgi:hypothetical protein